MSFSTKTQLQNNHTFPIKKYHVAFSITDIDSSFAEPKPFVMAFEEVRKYIEGHQNNPDQVPYRFHPVGVVDDHPYLDAYESAIPDVHYLENQMLQLNPDQQPITYTKRMRSVITSGLAYVDAESLNMQSNVDFHDMKYINTYIEFKNNEFRRIPSPGIYAVTPSENTYSFRIDRNVVFKILGAQTERITENNKTKIVTLLKVVVL